MELDITEMSNAESWEQAVELASEAVNEHKTMFKGLLLMAGEQKTRMIQVFTITAMAVDEGGEESPLLDGCMDTLAQWDTASDAAKLVTMISASICESNLKEVLSDEDEGFNSLIGKGVKVETEGDCYHGYV